MTRCGASPGRAMRWRPGSAWCTSTSCSSRCSPSPRTSCSGTSRRRSAAVSTSPRPADGCGRSPTASASTWIRTPSSRTFRSACSSAWRSSRRSLATPRSSCSTSPRRC
ncbi:hypothetical protein ABE10_12320 [Bacillus toyonensis]|nr:hypothetical protein [Bacillus toyonensis]